MDVHAAVEAVVGGLVEGTVGAAAHDLVATLRRKHRDDLADLVARAEEPRSAVALATGLAGLAQHDSEVAQLVQRLARTQMASGGHGSVVATGDIVQVARGTFGRKINTVNVRGVDSGDPKAG